MPGRSFVDTNILIYTDDHDAPGKQARALELLAELRRGAAGVVSTQVLQEYFAAVTRKLGVPAAVARRKVELFARNELVVLGLDHILPAIDLTRLRSISFWDALIVEAARSANCSVLYSEDLQHGGAVDGLRVVNPFADSAE